MSSYIKFILSGIILISWSCSTNHDKKIEEDIYEISTNVFPPAVITAKIDSISKLIKNGDEKLKLIRGFLYLNIANWENAERDFEYMIKKYPENSYAYTGMGILCMFNSDSAFFYFNKAIRLDEKNSLAYFGRSIVLETYPEKISAISKAIELYPECSMYYSWRGFFYKEMDSTELAIRDFNKSISFDRPSPLSFIILGIIDEQKGEYNKAFEMYDQCIARTARKRAGYEDRGQLFYKMGKHIEAINEYKKALTFNDTPNISDKSLNFSISQYYSLLNEKDSCKKYLDFALKNDTLYGKWLNEEDNFDNVKNTVWFKDYIGKYSK